MNYVEPFLMLVVGWFLGWWFSENTRVRRLERQNMDLQFRIAQAGKWTEWERSTRERKYASKATVGDIAPAKEAK